MEYEFVQFEQAVRSNDADTRSQLLTDDFVRRSKQSVYCLYGLTRTVASGPLLGFEKLFLAALLAGWMQ
jgi:hypothetical protein